MRKTVMLLCLLGAVAIPFPSWAAVGPSKPEPAVMDEALARQCLKLADTKDEVARSSALLERLYGLDHVRLSRLATLAREVLGGKSAEAAAVPPQENLRLAWLCTFLDAEAERLAFDLAEDGRCVRWIESGKRCRFRTFGKQEFVVHVNAATLGYHALQSHREAYSRVYLRKIPGSGDYYAAAWRGLIKNRQSPPAPNPEGRYVPFLMHQALPVIQSSYGGGRTSGAPFVRAFAERMQSPDQTTRLEACFRSVGLPELPEYVGVLRQVLTVGDELERLTALYALAAMTRRHEDIDAFLNAFPSDPALFYRFFDAEWELSGTYNTGVASFLLLLAYEPRTQERALPCLARLAYTNVCAPAEFLATYREDPLVAAYIAGHKENLLVPRPDSRIETLWPQTDWHAFMLSLMQSDDLLSSATAVLMEAPSLWPQKTPEVLRFQGTLYEPLVARRTFDRTRFMELLPLTAKELPDLLSVEKQVYRPPLNGLAGYLIAVGTDSPQLRALESSGRDFLEEYERQRIRKILE